MLMELNTFAYAAAAVFLASAFLVITGCALLGWPIPLLPPRRNRFVPWGGIEVLVVFSAVEVLIPLILAQLLQSSGLFHWLYDITGGNFGAQFSGDQDKEFRHLAIWETFLGFPFKVFLVAVLLHTSCDFRPYQLGFTKCRLWQMAALGWLAWLVWGLPCDLFHLLMSSGYARLFPQPPDVHAIAKIALENPSRFEWFLLISSAVVVAPVVEEFLFRGLLLRWLIAKPSGALATYGISLALAAMAITNRLDRAMDWLGVLNAAAPLLFVLLVICAAEALAWLKRDARACIRWRAILTSSLLFAIAHANVWPSPIALFVLAICLAWMACRTQSIIPCIVAHALFNSVACVELVMGTTS
ncbi:MAG TPA: CPBP family intramembrane glutamic endopeptidase [Gemmataceae bacterium]|jgi:membrane protease YdiL (CAAX protease family)|nr:CPBP family intramembrane glutamic endopeptidase [Gemmataceae bacterium]